MLEPWKGHFNIPPQPCRANSKNDFDEATCKTDHNKGNQPPNSMPLAAMHYGSFNLMLVDIFNILL